MTLQELAQIGGVVGVMASLIYVAIQIRNNSRAVRAATVLQISHTMMSSLFNMANSAELTGLVLRGGDDLSSLDRLDKARFRFHAMFILSFNQNIFIQHKIGTLKSDDWQSFKADLTSYFAMTGARWMKPQSAVGRPHPHERYDQAKRERLCRSQCGKPPAFRPHR